MEKNYYQVLVGKRENEIAMSSSLKLLGNLVYLYWTLEILGQWENQVT